MIFILSSIGFFLWVIRSILFWTSLWQVKEYRFDRLIVHLKETRQGRLLFVSPFFLGTIVLLAIYLGVIFHDHWVDVYHSVILFFFLLEGAFFIREIVQSTFKRPTPTLKSAVIGGLSLLAVVGLYIISLLDTYAWLVLVELIVPIIVALFVFAFSFPTEIYRDYLIQKAQKKLQRYPKILVIGVSGSVGKTSTKEYVAHILAKKFKVVKTPLSNNTPIAIANTILQKINASTQVFIVEIGSYKKGEVAQICDIIHPKISITTALGEQHISLYGSLENIIQTEAELLHSLPKDGIALLNANSTYMEKLYKKSKRHVILYGTSNTKHGKTVAISAKNITIERNGISFTTIYKKKILRFHTPLLGGHNVENILPAIYLAQYLGMKEKDIVSAVQTLTPLHKTMKKFTTQEGVILIDDSFNASPESVIAAVNYLTTYTHKRLFVLMPLIELGKKASEYHYRIGQSLAKYDYLFLTNKNYYKDIEKGINSQNGKCQLVVDNVEKISEKISDIAKKGDVVLFEGKEAGNVLSKIL